MTESRVFLGRLKDDASPEQRREMFRRLLLATGYADRIGTDELVGVKTHFGEDADGDFIPPYYFSVLSELIRSKGAQPFLCETSVLYKSPRCNAVTHSRLALEHGFGFEQTGMPIVMLDGLRGTNEREIEIPGELSQKVSLAADIANCSHMIVMSHVTGHLAAGLGACLKNMGMGLSSRKGKLQQHSESKLIVNQKECVACGVCSRHCAENAISLNQDKAGKAWIDYSKCIGCGECLAVCGAGAVKFRWDTSSEVLQKKMAEHALGAYLLAEKKMLFFNFLINVTKECDCLGKSDKVSPDIGILASLDPVAIDQASLDLILTETHKKLEDVSNHGGFDGSIQIRHAEKIGLGTCRYECVEVR